MADQCNSYTNYTVQVFPPHQYVAVAGRTATFQCFSIHDNIAGVQWLVNGSQNFDLANVMEEIHGSLGLLRFANIPVEYNTTTISCEIVLGSSRRETARESSRLLPALHSVVTRGALNNYHGLHGLPEIRTSHNFFVTTIIITLH